MAKASRLARYMAPEATVSTETHDVPYVPPQQVSLEDITVSTDIETVTRPSLEALQSADTYLSDSAEDEASLQATLEAFEEEDDQEEQELASLESLHTLLNQYVSAENHDPQVLHYVIDRLQSSHVDTLGVEDHEEFNSLKTSLEASSSTNYAQNQVLGRIAEILLTILFRATRNAAEKITAKQRQKSRENLVTAINTKADAALERLSKLGAEQKRASVDIDIKGKSNQRHWVMGGKAVTDPNRALQTDLKSTQFMLDNYISSAVDYNRQLFRILGDMRGSTRSEFSGEMEKILEIRSPNDAIPTGVLDGSALLNGIYVTFKEKDVKANGSDTNQHMKRLARTKPPKAHKQEVTLSDTISFNLTQSDAQALLRTAKQYAAIVDNFNRTYGVRVLEAPAAARSQQRDGARGDLSYHGLSNQYDIGYVAKVARRSPKYASKMASIGVDHARSVATAAISLAEQIGKELEKQS